MSLRLDNDLHISEKIESLFRKWIMTDASDQNQGTWSVASFLDYILHDIYDTWAEKFDFYWSL